jgi:hypothetical protein
VSLAKDSWLPKLRTNLLRLGYLCVMNILMLTCIWRDEGELKMYVLTVSVPHPQFTVKVVLAESCYVGDAV